MEDEFSAVWSVETISKSIVPLCGGDTNVAFAVLAMIACKVLNEVKGEEDLVQLIREFGLWLTITNRGLIEMSK